MFFTHCVLAFLAVGTAVSSHHFYEPDTRFLGKRQEYPAPAPTSCAPGNTCEESCGAGSQLCSDPDTFLCYRPAEQWTCCEQGTAAAWACPDGDYCLVNSYCCPRNENPADCARSFNVTLPATYVGPTATSSASSAASAVTTTSAPPLSAGTTSFSATAASTSMAVFTGAASPNTFTGGTGLIYGVLVLIGNLF